MENKTNKKTETYIVYVARNQYGETKVQARDRKEAMQKASKKIVFKWDNKNYGDVTPIKALPKDFSFLP